jgi:hypothetical protein
MSWASRPPHQAGESATTPQGDPGDIDSVSEREVVTKFAQAIESGDVDGVVSLPTMPPEPLEARARPRFTRFLSKVPAGGASRDVQALRRAPTANPPFGCYLATPKRRSRTPTAS